MFRHSERRSKFELSRDLSPLTLAAKADRAAPVAAALFSKPAATRAGHLWGDA